MKRSIQASRASRRGFTLIELLVVVAIIALLIAILLPSLGAARERAKKAACLANLHGIGSAMHIYANENRDVLPQPMVFMDPVDTKTVLVDVFFTNYLSKGPKLLFCPSDQNKMSTEITDIEWNVDNSARVSYDFYTVYFMPEWAPTTTRLGQAPLAWDLLGGAANPGPGQELWQNHGKTGGHVIYNNGSASWQDAKDWDMINWPHPAQEYYH
jgi:prepilin-type N-terminal cleavage/methylation domain-containing protein